MWACRVSLSKWTPLSHVLIKGENMKKLPIVVLSVALGLSLPAFSQYAGSSQSTGNEQGSSAHTSEQQGTSADQSQSGTGESSKKADAKLHHIKGTIGQDGKSFTSDKDNKTWSIMNPEAVKGHEGHHVRLEAHVYPDKEAVHVMGVKMMGEKTSESKSSDKSDNKPMSEQPPQ
jgi:hypothetical protein